MVLAVSSRPEIISHAARVDGNVLRVGLFSSLVPPNQDPWSCRTSPGDCGHSFA